MVVIGLSSSGEVINTHNRLENLGIGIEVAAVTRGQDMPFFEVSEGVFNGDPAARNSVFADHKVVNRIFKFLHPIEDYLTFEQNKPLLKLIFHNRNILFKELTQNNYPAPKISEIFLKLAVFTSANFDKIAPRDREFGFHKDQLKRFWQFIMKKIKLLSESDQPIVLDVRFIKLPPSEDLSEKK